MTIVAAADRPRRRCFGPDMRVALPARRLTSKLIAADETRRDPPGLGRAPARTPSSPPRARRRRSAETCKRVAPAPPGSAMPETAQTSAGGIERRRESRDLGRWHFRTIRVSSRPEPSLQPETAFRCQHLGPARVVRPGDAGAMRIGLVPEQDQRRNRQALARIRDAVGPGRQPQEGRPRAQPDPNRGGPSDAAPRNARSCRASRLEVRPTGEGPRASARSRSPALRHLAPDV